MNYGLPSFPNVGLNTPSQLLAQLIMFQNGVMQGEIAKVAFPLIYDMSSRDSKGLIEKDIKTLQDAPEKLKNALRTMKSENTNNDLKHEEVKLFSLKDEAKKQSTYDEHLEEYVATKLKDDASKEKKALEKETSKEHVVTKKQEKQGEYKTLLSSQKDGVIFNKNETKQKEPQKQSTEEEKREVSNNREEARANEPQQQKMLLKNKEKTSFKQAQENNKSEPVNKKDSSLEKKLNIVKKTPEKDLNFSEKLKLPESQKQLKEANNSSFVNERASKAEDHSLKPSLKEAEQIAQKIVQEEGQGKGQIKSTMPQSQEGFVKSFASVVGFFALPHYLQEKIKTYSEKIHKFKFKKVKKKEKSPKEDSEVDYHTVDDIS